MNDDPEIDRILRNEDEAMHIAVEHIGRYSPIKGLPVEAILRKMTTYRSLGTEGQLSRPEAEFLLRGDFAKIAEALRSQTASSPQLTPPRQAAIYHAATVIGVDAIRTCDKLWTAVAGADWEAAHDELMMTKWPMAGAQTDEDRQRILDLCRMLRTGVVPAIH